MSALRRPWLPWLASLVLSSHGCGGTSAGAPDPPALPDPPAAPDLGTPPTETLDGVTLALSYRHPDERLIAVITVSDPIRSLRAAAPGDRDPFSGVSARDSDGPLDVDRRVEGGVIRLVLSASDPAERASPVTISIERPISGDDRVATAGRAAVLSLDTLPLPADDRARPTRIIAGETDQVVFATHGATGVGAVEATTAELADVRALVGEAETARFESRDGIDDVAVAGPHQLDIRWLGAETALIRTRVDRYVGRLDPGRFTTLVRAETSPPGAAPVAITPAGRGLAVTIDPDATWDAGGRVTMAHVLLRRWVGGLVRISDGEDWFSLGVSRYFALRVLISLGLLAPEELAGQLDLLERALSFPRPDDPRAIHLSAMARGALYAARLDALLHRARSDDTPTSLRLMLFPFFGDGDHPPLTFAWIRDEIARALGEAEAARFLAAVSGEGAIEVPAGSFGSCVASRRGRVRRFALGFDLPEDLVLPLTLGPVTGPAAAAGLREGDSLEALSFLHGDPGTEVVARVAGDPPRTARYMPFDEETRGRVWEPGDAGDDECAPR